MGGDPAPKIKAPAPKRVPPTTPPPEPVHPAVAPGYGGHPGGNALDALAKAEHPPPPAHLTDTPPRQPHIVRSAAVDYARAGLFAMSPLFGPTPTISSLEEAVAAALVVELKGHPWFEPNVLLARYIQQAGDAGAVVKVRYSKLCAGTIVIRWDGCAYQADPIWLAIHMADLVPRDPASQLGLAVWMVDGKFHGLVTTAHAVPGKADEVVDEPEGLFRTVFGRSYHGPDSLYLYSYENTLSEGDLRVVASFDLHPPDGPTLNGLFSLIDEDFRFMAHGTLSVEGADVDPVNVSRTPRGILRALPNVNFADSWKAHGFEGGFEANFYDGSFEAKGRVKLAYPKAKPFIQGDVNVVVTTPEKAWAAAKANDPSPQVTGGISRTNETDHGLALVAWGRLDMILAPGSPKVGKKDATSPLKAQAMFLVDPEGEITARGILRMPRELVLVPAFRMDSGSIWPFPFHKVLVGGEILAILGAEIRVYADLKAWANIGPFSLRDLVADGTYSTRPGVGSEIVLAGSFNASAEAHLVASAGVEVRATVGVHLPWPLPDITAGQTLINTHVSGDASLKAYVDARPEITRKGGAVAEEPPQYKVHGNLHVAGELLVKLEAGGTFGIPDLFQKAGSVGKTIRLASGGFGVEINHVFGSDSMPEISYDKVDFDPKKFVKAATDPATKAVTNPKTHGQFHEEMERGHKQSPDTPVTTAPTPMQQTPDRKFELSLPVKIHDARHTLVLVVRPDNKSDLLMKSVPHRVLELIRDSIGRLDDLVNTPITDPDELVEIKSQRDELEQLHDDVVELIGEANAFAPEVEFLTAANLPEYVEVAGELAEYGERYGDDNLTGASRLLTAGYEDTDVGAVSPEHYSWLGARRIGNSEDFDGSFDQVPPWNWDDFPSGPVTRHPINDALRLRDVNTLEELKPSGEYYFDGEETHGAEAIKEQVAEWRGDLWFDSNERKKAILAKEPDLSDQEARRRAHREVEKFWAAKGYPEHEFHELQVIKTTTWQCHHIHENSWGGDDRKSNLIYLVLANEHNPISVWFNARRDDIKLHLRIPLQSTKPKSKKAKKP